MNNILDDFQALLARKSRMLVSVLEREIFLKGYLAGIDDQQKYGYVELSSTDKEIMQNTLIERYKLKYDREKAVFFDAYLSGIYSQMDNDWRPVSQTEEEMLKHYVYR